MDGVLKSYNSSHLHTQLKKIEDGYYVAEPKENASYFLFIDYQYMSKVLFLTGGVWFKIYRKTLRGKTSMTGLYSSTVNCCKWVCRPVSGQKSRWPSSRSYSLRRTWWTKNWTLAILNVPSKMHKIISKLREMGSSWCWSLTEFVA